MTAQQTTSAALQLLQLRYGIVGNSPLLLEAIEKLLQIAPTDLTVLITGETGTGKDVFARAMHGLSPRRKAPFISVNCGAIPETLLESELFGHEKGAFTGAVEQRKGFFEVANGGTMFLDEIGEMPLGTQVKLLRVLENGEFTRLGSTQVIKVDVRVIAATNRDLAYEVRQGRFREDLFYRLNAVHIHLPPLRKRLEDIPLLVEYYGTKVAERLGISYEGIEPEAIAVLQQHNWRGNVRELRNLVETLVTIGQGRRITAEDVRRYLKREEIPEPSRALVLHSAPPAEQPPLDLGLVYQTLLQLHAEMAAVRQALATLAERFAQWQSVLSSLRSEGEEDISRRDPDDFRLDEMERRLIIAALKRFNGSRRSAARALGISERTLYRKLHEYNLTEMF
ncbi:MAG: sigma-54 dependent transcriptional regulator [Bacteroidota bacterium]|nr:sigma-54 dependent transcriptional regulator [Bacteroidota bacterium]MDW8271516.1 sigma-54 dependent transcriptional regulator [Bacteroidota bacterium]